MAQNSQVGRDILKTLWLIALASIIVTVGLLMINSDPIEPGTVTEIDTGTTTTLED